MRLDKCPSKIEFAKAVGATPSSVLEAHLTICPRCHEEWDRQHRLLGMASEMPKRTVSSAKAAKMHDALLKKAALKATPSVQGRRALWIAAASIIALVSGALVFGLFETDPNGAEPSPSTALERATVHPLAGAKYRTVSPQPDEMVRLLDGTVTVSVDKLDIGERFRVITGDAEVEVIGTVFEVTVENDTLVAVRVLSGTVEVRPHDRTAVVLESGERWERERPTPEPETQQLAEENQPTTERPTVREEKPKRRFGARRQKRVGSSPAVEPPEKTSTDSHTEAVDEKTDGRDAVDVEMIFNTGWRRFREGNFADAARAFEEVTRVEEKKHLREDAAYCHAMARLKAGNDAKAKQAMKQYLTEYPRSRRASEIATRLGWLSFEAGRHDDAARYFEVGTASSDPKVKKSAQSGLRAIDAKSE